MPKIKQKNNNNTRVIKSLKNRKELGIFSLFENK